jgi:hypothetical protein
MLVPAAELCLSLNYHVGMLLWTVKTLKELKDPSPKMTFETAPDLMVILALGAMSDQVLAGVRVAVGSPHDKGVESRAALRPPLGTVKGELIRLRRAVQNPCIAGGVHLHPIWVRS